MIKAKLLKHIRSGIKLLKEGNDYQLKQRGITKIGAFNNELPTRFFIKSPLSLVPASEYYKNPEAARDKIKNALDQLVDEGYLTVRQHTEKSFYYKPTDKVANNVDDTAE